jgi:twitching motility protein PilT
MGDIIQTEFPLFTPDKAKEIIESIMNSDQIAGFNKTKELDFAFTVNGLSRFRINVYSQKGSMSCSIRPVPLYIPKFESLNLPHSIQNFKKLQRGLVLVTGPAGSGKSTTLAAIIELINMTRKCHIVTIEDPIEYVHENKESIIEQRELHSDTDSFAAALKHVLRQSPDVIMVGELRDLETISTAITAAETGHLVLSTLHTIDAGQTIHRIVDVFPPAQQSQIRMQLAGALQGVISQQLLPRRNKREMVPATEIMMMTSAIKTLIVNNDIQQIPLHLHTGKENGMHTLNQSLRRLYKQHLISYDTAIKRSAESSELKKILLMDLERTKPKKKKGLSRHFKILLNKRSVY